MIDSASGIEVELRTVVGYKLRTKLAEWKAGPSSEHYAHNRNECFTEAVSAQDFGCKIAIPQDFDWMGADCLRIDFIFDGGVLKAETYMWKQEWTLTRHEAHKVFFEHDGVVPPAYILNFEEAEIIDGPSPVARPPHQGRAHARGTIEVVVWRSGAPVGRRSIDQLRDLGFPVLHQVSRALAVDQGKAHYICPVKLPAGTRLHAHLTSGLPPAFKPLDNDDGGEARFVFQYRNRKYLQNEGIMPPSPPPPPPSPPRTTFTAINGTEMSPKRRSSAPSELTARPKQYDRKRLAPPTGLNEGLPVAVDRTGRQDTTHTVASQGDAEISNVHDGIQRDEAPVPVQPNSNATAEPQDNAAQTAKHRKKARIELELLKQQALRRELELKEEL